MKMFNHKEHMRTDYMYLLGPSLLARTMLTLFTLVHAKRKSDRGSLYLRNLCQVHQTGGGKHHYLPPPDAKASMSGWIHDGSAAREPRRLVQRVGVSLHGSCVRCVGNPR